MKKLLLILNLFLINNIYSATFTISPNNITDIAACSGATEYLIALTNDSAQELSLAYTLLQNTFPDSGCWDLTICDCNQCFALNTIPTGSTCGPIASGDTNNVFFALDIHNTHGFQGGGTLQFLIYEQSNPSNSDTLTFNISACAGGNTCTVGIKENMSSNRLIIYPNPAHEVLNVQLDNFETTITRVSVYDIFSNEVKAISSPATINSEIEIDIANLSIGLYLVKLESEAETYSEKFFVTGK